MLGMGIAVSFWVARRADSETWSVGGRSLPMYVIAGTQFATGMGGGVLVAHVGIGYGGGWSAITYNVLYSIGVVLLVLLASWLKKHNFTTLPNIFQKLYGENKTMMSIVTFMAIVVPFGWLCTNMVAFGNLFSEITGFSFTLLIVIFATISVLFVLPAGLKSVAWADFLYGCIMVILMIATGFYAVNSVAGGWSEVTANVPENMVSFPEGLGAIGMGTVVLWVFAILPGALTNQMSYQRIYAAKSVKTARQGFIIAAIVAATCGIWASIMGMSVLSQNPGIDNSELATGWFLNQIPIWFLAIFSAFIIATLMSTVSSAIQSVVVNITRDIYKTYINPNIGDQMLKNASRILSVVVVILAVLLSLLFPQALGWLEATYSYSAATLLVPIFLGFALRHSNFLSAKGVIGSIFVGITSTAIAQILNTTIPYAVFGVLGSLAGFLVFNMIFYKTEMKAKKDEAS